MVAHEDRVITGITHLHLPTISGSRTPERLVVVVGRLLVLVLLDLLLILVAVESSLVGSYRTLSLLVVTLATLTYPF